MAISVLFSYQNCGSVYRATQDESGAWIEGPRRFDCTVCGRAVHSWDEGYEYVEWTLLHTSDAVQGNRS